VNFIGRYTFWEKLEPTCHMSKARPNHLVRPALQVWSALPGATSPTPWLIPGQEHLLSLEQYLYEHDSLKNIGLIQRWKLGSMGLLVRPLNRHNRHSEVILVVPERRRCITRHRGQPAAPIHSCAGPNRPKEPTYNFLRSSDQGCPRREAVDHKVGHT
jgi:hypothetical protein